MSAMLAVFCCPSENSPSFSTCSVSPCQAARWQWLRSFTKVPNSYLATFSKARSYSCPGFCLFVCLFCLFGHAVRRVGS